MKNFKLYIIFSFLLFSLLKNSSAQLIVTGHIEDAKTEDPLVAANIQIVGTFQGTISNEDGDFILLLDELPASLSITYIGYESQKVVIENADDKDIFIALEGPLLTVDCVEHPEFCTRCTDCVTRHVWTEIQDSIMNVMTSITLQDLVDKSLTGKSTLDYQI